jgi:BMFP domain-containing protein YqiC
MIDLNQIDDLARRLSDLVPPGLRESREELQATFKSAAGGAGQAGRGDARRV